MWFSAGRELRRGTASDEPRCDEPNQERPFGIAA